MKRPVVGICCVVTRGDNVLLGKRKGGVCAGYWGFPGGHLEGGETFAQAAKRELAEETGLRATRVQQGSTLNCVWYTENRHFVDVFMLVDVHFADDPVVMEPENCEKWKWFKYSTLPHPLMLGTQQALVDMINEGMLK